MSTIKSAQFQYDASQHKSGSHSLDYAGGRSSCGQCHSGSGYIEHHTIGKVSDNTTPDAINCETCHTLHQTFTYDDFGFRGNDAVELLDLESKDVLVVFLMTYSHRFSYYKNGIPATVPFGEDNPYIKEHLKFISPNVEFNSVCEQYFYLRTVTNLCKAKGFQFCIATVGEDDGLYELLTDDAPHQNPVVLGVVLNVFDMYVVTEFASKS